MADEIIGRREELLALEAFLEAVPAGGQALLLEGDAGSARRRSGRRGCASRASAASACCGPPDPSETQVAFATVGDLFAPTSGATLPRLVPVQRRALEIALLLRESDGRPPDTRLLALALLSIVRALARGRALSRRARRRAMARRQLSGGAQVHAAAAGRRAGGRSRDSARAARRGAARARPRLRGVPAAPDRAALGRGDPSASLGSARAQPAAAGAHARPRDRGGNPFFALELGRALVDGTIRADGADVALPESLRAVVAERLRALPARVRETLVAVAALAAPSVALLEALGPAVVDDIELAQNEACSSSTATGSASPIRFSHPPATRRCRCTGGVGSTAASPSWMSISKSAPAISRSRPPGPTRRSQPRSMRRQPTPMPAAPPRLLPSSPSARSR